MDPARQYSVMTTGNIESGFDEDQVAADFATLLCSPMETAQTFINAKKCVVADIDEDRARLYEASLTEIGLQVVLVPSDGLEAANDDYSGDESPASESAAFESTYEQDEQDEVVEAEPERSPFDEPAARSFAPSYAAPIGPVHSSDTLVVDLRTPESYEYDLDKDHTRVYRLAFLGLVAAVLAGTVVMTRDQVASSVSALTGSTTYVETAKASDEVNKLLELSGLNAQFESYTASLPDLFEEFFEPLIEEDSSITKADVTRVMSLIPKAYNDDALKISVGNRLNRMAYASDILVLQDVYEKPVVQSYVQRTKSRNVLKDRADFERFKTELETKPLSRARLTAVAAVVDAMGLDKAVLDIKRDFNRNLIITAGELRADNDTPEAKARVQENIKLILEQTDAEASAIRLERIALIAWQYEHADIGDLHLLRKATDRSLVRTLIRETTSAQQNFLREATLWLHRNLDGG